MLLHEPTYVQILQTYLTYNTTSSLKLYKLLFFSLNLFKHLMQVIVSLHLDDIAYVYKLTLVGKYSAVPSSFCHMHMQLAAQLLLWSLLHA